METPKGLYGRLGWKRTLDSKLAECQAAGFTTMLDLEAGTAGAVDGHTKVLSALHKGGGAWIIMYNPAYYPKPVFA